MAPFYEFLRRALFYILISIVVLSFVWKVRSDRASPSLSPTQSDKPDAESLKLKEQLDQIIATDTKLHAENLKLVNQIYELQNELGREISLNGVEQSRSKAQQELGEKIWKIKRSAREIIQRWPGSYFERRPLDKESWNTRTPFGFASQWPPPYVDPALGWFDQFCAASLLFPGCADWTWLKGLSFDRLMEVLDLAERQARGVWFPPPMPADNPLVDIVRYGKGPPDSIADGFYLVNHHTKVALDLQIDPTRMGRFSLTFEGPHRLAIGDPECFFAIDVEREPHRHCSGALCESIREWQECADDWAFQLPISVVYRDFENRWYRTICGIQPDPMASMTQEIRVSFIGYEMIEPRR
jgi:hypothetical protein